MDRTAFKAGRTFATLAADGLTANIKFPADVQALKTIVAPDAFAPVAGGWGRMGWTRAVLVAMSETELHDALLLAFTHAWHGKKAPRQKPKQR